MAPKPCDRFTPGVYRPTFRQALWCRGAHAQTIWPFLFRRQQHPPYRRERVALPDGDFLDLDWLDTEGPVVLLLHGLEGCSLSQYIIGQVNALTAAGYSAVVMHFRGCSGAANRLARTYHAGDTADIAYVVEHIAASRTLFGAVGYSLGGNALLKWLAECRNAASLTTAVAISVPYDLNRAAVAMESGMSRIYQRRLLGLLHRKTRTRFSNVGAPIDIQNLSGWNTFRKFDHHVTAPLHGFANVDEYYSVASSKQYLRHIVKPVLLLHASDDPFMTPDTAPTASELSDSTRLELSAHGGHVGFVSGRIRPTYWLDGRVVQHLNLLR